MAIVKIQKNRMNERGAYDVIHYETDADIVLMPDGETSVSHAIDQKADVGHEHVVDDELNDTSNNPVQNKVVNKALSQKLSADLVGKPNGLAELDANGRVPSSQLPSYVDDIIEGTYVSETVFTDTDSNELARESGKIYVDTTNNKTYRWSGTQFVVISETLALGEKESTAYRGDRGKAAYDHSIEAHANPNATVTKKSSTNGKINIDGVDIDVYTHPNSGVGAGTYKSVKVNAQGHIISGTNPATLSEYGIKDAVPNSRTINSKPLTDNIELDADDVGALPITGGALSGQVLGVYNNYTRVYSGKYMSQFEHLAGQDPANRTLMFVSDTADLSKSVGVLRNRNGAGLDNEFYLYGEHNKPTASDVGARADTWMPTATDIGALPIAGGTLTGGNLGVGNGYTRIISSSSMSQFEHLSGKDPDNRTMLYVDDRKDLSKSIGIIRSRDGSGLNKGYSIYGEHNKPTILGSGGSGLHYPVLDLAKRQELMKLVTSYYNAAVYQNVKYTGDITRNIYGVTDQASIEAEGGPYRIDSVNGTDVTRLKMNCSLFCQMLWAGISPNTFWIGDTPQNFAPKWSDYDATIEHAFTDQWGYYFKFPKTAAYGLKNQKTGDIIGYIANPTQDHMLPYSTNTHYTGAIDNDKGQSFRTYMYASDMADELSLMGCEIPMGEVMEGDLVFFKGREGADELSLETLSSLSYRNIDHVAIVINVSRKAEGYITFAECSPYYGNSIGYCALNYDRNATPDRNANIVRAADLLDRVVMVARHPAAFGIVGSMYEKTKIDQLYTEIKVNP